MGTYELWRMLMYGVGVFVTCNAGGVALRVAWRRVAPEAGRPRKRPEELSAAPDKASGGAAPDGWTPQTFADMRRQYENTDMSRQRETEEAAAEA